MIAAIILLLTLINASFCCITHSECLSSIHNTLTTYDEHQSRLEYTLDRHLHDISFDLSNKIIALNNKMLNGPPLCQLFLENTVDHYIKVLNKTCPHDYDQNRHISHAVWDKFQALNPHFFDVTIPEEVTLVCDILVMVLTDFCEATQHKINSVLDCKFLDKFDQIFVKPWHDCVAGRFN